MVTFYDFMVPANHFMVPANHFMVPADYFIIPNYGKLKVLVKIPV